MKWGFIFIKLRNLHRISDYALGDFRTTLGKSPKQVEICRKYVIVNDEMFECARANYNQVAPKEMRALEYQAVKFYFDEAKKALNQRLYIAYIAVCEILSELMARELASDERSKLVDVLKKLCKDGKISPKQDKWFSTIRLMRNRYVHINLGEEIETSFMGMVKEESNGSMTFLKEIIAGSYAPETEAIKLHRLCAEKDAHKVLTTFEKLIDTLDL